MTMTFETAFVTCLHSLTLLFLLLQCLPLTSYYISLKDSHGEAALSLSGWERRGQSNQRWPPALHKLQDANVINWLCHCWEFLLVLAVWTTKALFWCSKRWAPHAAWRKAVCINRIQKSHTFIPMICVVHQIVKIAITVQLFLARHSCVTLDHFSAASLQRIGHAVIELWPFFCERS